MPLNPLGKMIGMKKVNTTVDDVINGSSSATEKFHYIGISMEDLKGKSREEYLIRGR